MIKYVFVTGGVVSSLGKGIAAASLAAARTFSSFPITLIRAIFSREQNSAACMVRGSSPSGKMICCGSAAARVRIC